MNYQITNNISEATHWLAYEDNDWVIKNCVIPGKAYELYLLRDEFTTAYDEIIEDTEYFIIDEEGKYSMHYMFHNGDYIIKK